MKFFPDIDDQIAGMKTTFPDIIPVQRESATAIWRGPVRPFLKTYVIEIGYRVPMVVERLDLLRLQPRVRVLTPALRPRRGDPEGELPHVYMAGNQVLLCLFDPDTREWTPCDLLSETTVRYAIDWLACYEGWRATREWAGGGRHAKPLANMEITS